MNADFGILPGFHLNAQEKSGRRGNQVETMQKSSTDNACVRACIFSI